MTDAAQGHRRLSWRVLILAIAAWSGLLVPVILLLGPAIGGAVAIAGLLPGFAGHVVAKRSVAPITASTLLLLIAAFMAAPSPALAWGGAVLFSLATGTEAYFRGGRSCVLALYAWCALVLSPGVAHDLTALPWIALGLLWGSVSARWIGVAEKAVIPPLPLRESIALSLFLLLGLLLASRVMAWLDTTYGYWVMVLFVMRAIAPPQKEVQAALLFGTGAVFGSAVALGLTLAGIGPVLSLGLALALILIGLRFLPHPGPWTATCLTAAVLLLLPVGSAEMLLRAEVAVIAVVLTILLILTLGWGWRAVAWVSDRFAEQPDHKA